MTCQHEPLDFGEVTKHPSERLVIEFEWLPNIANVWQRGSYYEAGVIARPTKPNGFAARCDRSGQSGYREPRWPQSEGLSVEDGSALWTIVPANLDGIDLIVANTVTADSGLTMLGSQHTGDEVRATVEGGTDLSDYGLTCQVQTQSGQILVGVLTVKVRARRVDQCV